MQLIIIPKFVNNNKPMMLKIKDEKSMIKVIKF